MNEILSFFSLSSWERFLYSIIAQGRDIDVDVHIDIDGYIYLRSHFCVYELINE